MHLNNSRRLAGWIALVGAAQFLLVLAYSEYSYPGFSFQNTFISDLGVGKTAVLFNASLIVAGAAMALVALLGFYVEGHLLASFFVFLDALAIIGVGAFPENTGFLHEFFSHSAFFLGGVIAVASGKYAEPPLSYFCILMGGISLLSAALFTQGVTLGLGKGGIEHLIVIPFLLWAMAFGRHLSS